MVKPTDFNDKFFEGIIEAVDDELDNLRNGSNNDPQVKKNAKSFFLSHGAKLVELIESMRKEKINIKSTADIPNAVVNGYISIDTAERLAKLMIDVRESRIMDKSSKIIDLNVEMAKRELSDEDVAEVN